MGDEVIYGSPTDRRNCSQEIFCCCSCQQYQWRWQGRSSGFEFDAVQSNESMKMLSFLSCCCLAVMFSHVIHVYSFHQWVSPIWLNLRYFQHDKDVYFVDFRLLLKKVSLYLGLQAWKACWALFEKCQHEFGCYSTFPTLIRKPQERTLCMI